jgi:hypothetical protein
MNLGKDEASAGRLGVGAIDSRSVCMSSAKSSGLLGLLLGASQIDAWTRSKEVWATAKTSLTGPRCVKRWLHRTH